MSETYTNTVARVKDDKREQSKMENLSKQLLCALKKNKVLSKKDSFELLFDFNQK